MSAKQMTIVPDPEPTFLATLERIATNPNVPIETIERLLAVQERVMGKRAEDEFNLAMSVAQGEMGRVSADAENPQTRSKYASYGQLDRALRPVYTKHGFALSFGEGETAKPDHVRIVCWVTHRGGHTRMYHCDMPADGMGAKGGAVMTKTHAAGAAHSYAKRYLLKDIFNVAIGEDDRDGNKPPAGPAITEKQAADLTALVEEVGKTMPQLLKKLKLARIEDLPAKEYDEVVAMVERHRK